MLVPASAIGNSPIIKQLFKCVLSQAHCISCHWKHPNFPLGSLTSQRSFNERTSPVWCEICSVQSL